MKKICLIITLIGFLFTLNAAIAKETRIKENGILASYTNQERDALEVFKELVDELDRLFASTEIDKAVVDNGDYFSLGSPLTLDHTSMGEYVSYGEYPYEFIILDVFYDKRIKDDFSKSYIALTIFKSTPRNIIPKEVVCGVIIYQDKHPAFFDKCVKLKEKFQKIA